MKRKIFGILFALVLVLSFSLIPAMTATVSASDSPYILVGDTIQVTSQHLCELGAETPEAFNNEPETLVVDSVAFDAQSRRQVTIEGEVSDLNLGTGWVNTAYVEIGLRPEATMNTRNAGVYLIALNGDSGTEIHLQDFTGGGRTGSVITITKDAAFRYRITLTPSDDIGGTATLQVWVGDELQSTQPSLQYGYASTWQENVAGALDEDFSNARLFYSIIADRRGAADQTYSATVGDITIDDTLYVGAGQQFATIQDAINFANPGDTISVAAGTYDLSFPISVNKALTITGDTATPSNVIINAPTGDVDMDCFQVKADNVTIQGFKMQGAKDADFSQNAGVMIGTHWDGPAIVGLQNINISYNEITDCTRGIYVYRAQNVTISNNKIHDIVVAGAQASAVWPGKAIELRGDGDPTETQCNNIDILNNEIYNCELLGIEVNLWEMTGTEPVDVQLVIDGNIIYNNGGNWAPIVGRDAYVYRGISTNGQVKNVTISNNEIYGHTSATHTPERSGGIRIVDDTEYTIEDNFIHDNYCGIVHHKYDYEGPSNFDITGNNFQDNIVQLDDSAWKTVSIQSVLDTNTFDRAVTVDRPGDSLLHTIWSNIQDAIDAAEPGDIINVAAGTYQENILISKSLTVKGAYGSIIDGSANAAAGWDGSCIRIAANGVTIDGFEIKDGANGIAGVTSNSIIKNNKIHDNLNYVGSNGAGILLWGKNDNNQILNNQVYNNDRQGIFIGHCDWNRPPIIKVSTGNTISGNVIYNNGLYTQENGPDASAYGIQLWNADNNTIEGNEIYSHNDWFPDPDNRPDFDWAQGIYLCGSYGNIVKENHLHNNNTGIGVAFIYREAGEPNQIHFNDIVDNEEYGVWNRGHVTDEGSDIVDAALNWWGDISGPQHDAPFETFPANPGGTGDRVSDNVNYVPWLTREFETVLEDNIAYFGIPMVYLNTGWNTFSTPIALDPGYDTWGEYIGLGDGLAIHPEATTYYFDGEEQVYVQVLGSYRLKPCDAIYVRMLEPDIAAILFSPDLSVASKELHAGWNLVSLAWLPEGPDGDGDGEGPDGDGDGGPCLALGRALATVYTVTGDLTGWSLVVNPPVNWWFWGKPWSSFLRAQWSGVFEDSPPMCITRGYWVFMINPGTLAGFTSTPIPLEMPY